MFCKVFLLNLVRNPPSENRPGFSPTWDSFATHIWLYPAYKTFTGRSNTLEVTSCWHGLVL